MDDDRHWLERPRTITWLWRGGIAILGLWIKRPDDSHLGGGHVRPVFLRRRCRPIAGALGEALIWRI